jgi:hypothetical protein
MPRIDLAARAKLVILPSCAGEAALSPARRDGTVADAVRHVMEVLPPEERHRAVIQTPTRLMFFSEIEAIFETVVTRAPAHNTCIGAV